MTIQNYKIKKSSENANKNSIKYISKEKLLDKLNLNHVKDSEYKEILELAANKNISFQWCNQKIKVYRNEKYFTCYKLKSSKTSDIKKQFSEIATSAMNDGIFSYNPNNNLDSSQPVDPYGTLSLKYNINTSLWLKKDWDNFLKSFTNDINNDFKKFDYELQISNVSSITENSFILEAHFIHESNDDVEDFKNYVNKNIKLFADNNQKPNLNSISFKQIFVVYDQLKNIDYCDTTTDNKKNIIFSSKIDIPINNGEIILSESLIRASTSNIIDAELIIFLLSNNTNICFQINDDELVASEIKIVENIEKDFYLNLFVENELPESLNFISFWIDPNQKIRDSQIIINDILDKLNKESDRLINEYSGCTLNCYKHYIPKFRFKKENNTSSDPIEPQRLDFMFQNNDLYIDELANRLCTNCKNKDGYLLRTLPPQNPCDAWLELCYNNNQNAENVCNTKNGLSSDNTYFNLSKEKSPLRSDNYIVDLTTNITITDSITVVNNDKTSTLSFTKSDTDLNLSFLKNTNTLKINDDNTIYTVTNLQNNSDALIITLSSENTITLNNSYNEITFNEISATLFDYKMFCGVNDDGTDGFMRGCANYNGCLLRNTGENPLNCGEIVSYSESNNGTCIVDSGYFLTKKPDYKEIDTGFFRICKHKEDENSNSCFVKVENQQYNVEEYSTNDNYNLCRTNYENCIINKKEELLRESAIGYIYSESEKTSLSNTDDFTVYNPNLLGKETGTPACSYTDCSDLGIELYFLHLFTYFKILHLKNYLSEDEEGDRKIKFEGYVGKATDYNLANIDNETPEADIFNPTGDYDEDDLATVKMDSGPIIDDSTTSSQLKKNKLINQNNIPYRKRIIRKDNKDILRINYLRNLFKKLNLLEKKQKQNILRYNEDLSNSLKKSSLSRNSVFVFDTSAVEDELIIDEDGLGAPPANFISTQEPNYVTKHSNVLLGKLKKQNVFSTEYVIDYKADEMPDFIKNDTSNKWTAYKDNNNYIYKLYGKRLANNQGQSNCCWAISLKLCLDMAYHKLFDQYAFISTQEIWSLIHKSEGAWNSVDPNCAFSVCCAGKPCGSKGQSKDKFYKTTKKTWYDYKIGEDFIKPNQYATSYIFNTQSVWGKWGHNCGKGIGFNLEKFLNNGAVSPIFMTASKECSGNAFDLGGLMQEISKAAVGLYNKNSFGGMNLLTKKVNKKKLQRSNLVKMQNKQKKNCIKKCNKKHKGKGKKRKKEKKLY